MTRMICKCKSAWDEDEFGANTDSYDFLADEELHDKARKLFNDWIKGNKKEVAEIIENEPNKIKKDFLSMALISDFQTLGRINGKEQFNILASLVRDKDILEKRLIKMSSRLNPFMSKVPGAWF